MSGSNSEGTAARRLQQTAATITGGTPTPWNPDSSFFPTRKDLPKLGHKAPEGAAWVWGEDDQLGRINLLTPRRVAAAAKSLIKDGEMVSLNLPLDKPKVPGFQREAFQHHIKPLVPDRAYDDIYTLNTQSGTQWDGFRHVAFQETAQFYNGTTGADIDGPSRNSHKCSIHHWGDHGIGGRGVLVDYWSYAQANGITYDPFKWYSISYDELKKAAKSQGIDLRPAAKGGDIQIGDILLVRSGWVNSYDMAKPEERARVALRGLQHDPFQEGNDSNSQTYAGVSSDDDMVDFIHDSYFAAVAGDAPAFEAWPSRRADGKMLHEYILALWGMPLGEMFDLEKLARCCKEKKRWTFFFSSSPANVPGGVSSHANAQAIF